MTPAVADAQGFWQVPRGGEPAPGFKIDRAAEFRVSTGRQTAGLETGQTPTVVSLPGAYSRFGIAVTQKQGRPSFDGLAWRAGPNMRISADGDFDFDEGSLSGQVRFHFDF